MIQSFQDEIDSGKRWSPLKESISSYPHWNSKGKTNHSEIQNWLANSKRSLLRSTRIVRSAVHEPKHKVWNYVLVHHFTGILMPHVRSPELTYLKQTLIRSHEQKQIKSPMRHQIHKQLNYPFFHFLWFLPTRQPIRNPFEDWTKQQKSITTRSLRNKRRE